MKQHFITVLTAAMALTASVTASAGEYVPKIVAGVVKADSWTSTTHREGIYRLEAIPGGTLTQLNDGRDVYLAPLGGAVYEDGKMKGIHFRTFEDPYSASGVSYAIYNVEYDMSTWAQTKFKSLGDLYGNLISSCGITHDPVTGKNFGIFFNFDMNYNVLDRKLCTIDFGSDIPKKTQITKMETVFSAIAAGADGRLYGVSREGYLYTINKDTGKLTLIGDLRVTDISANPSSMTFDPQTEKLYWNYVTKGGVSYLYEIDYTIGSVSAERIMQIPDNAYLVNMHIPLPEAADSAPAAVLGLQASFPGESFTGTVEFVMPALAYDDSPLSGELTYTVYDNDRVAATGKAEAAADVSVSVTATGGETTIKVTASNNAGEGAAATVKLFIGTDTPTAVSKLHFNYDADAGRADVSWKAPVDGVHGNVLTSENLRYKVVRQPGNVVVATEHGSTSFSEDFSNPAPLKAFWYEVSTVNGAFTGVSAASNKVVIGEPLVLPFHETFVTQAGFDIFTVIDANDDGATWQRHHYVSSYSDLIMNYARIEADRNNPDDDWLLLPPMRLEKGGIYEIAFNAKKQYSTSDCNQRLEVLVGKGNDVSAYTQVLDPIDITNVNFADFSKEFSVADDGVYHVAFHAISNAGSAALDIDEMKLNILASASSPQAVTDLAIAPDPTGDLKATVSFKTPSQSLSGSPLASLVRIEVRDDDNRLVGQLQSPAVGQPASVEISGLQNGHNTFHVTAHTASDAGMRASVSAFIGQDVPSVPTAVVLADNGTDAVLSWKAPETGANGLFVNPARMTFDLHTYNDRGYLNTIATGISSPYVTGVKTNTGEQTLLYYALTAESTGGSSEPVPTNGLVVGAPYALPYEQSFADAEWGDRFVWMEGEYADWNIGLTRDISSDDDGGSLAFIPHRADFGSFNLGKISLAGAASPTLLFDCYVFPGTTSHISVAVDKFPQGITETIWTLKFENEKEEGWKPAVVSLADFKDEPFVIVKFSMASSSTDAPVVIDNIRIKDDPSGIADVIADIADSAPYTVYSIDGRLLRRNAASLESLSPGFYIVNGTKVHVK